jgi:1,4-dihydroxy-6-naphthoate synthase
MRIRFGISPCPNDTFAFHGLLTGASDRHGLELELQLLDVQELNERLARGELAAGKASFAQALRLTRDFGVLPVGSALGFGVGPLLLAKGPRPPPDEKSRILAPGEGTTANLLLRLFHPRVRRIEQVHFARIMPLVASGAADFGVVIHEGRFTYRRHGLHCVEDLGTTWEQRTRSPLPLGGLLARRDLGGDLHRRLAAAVRDSLALARSHRDDALATMRRHAQELDDAAIWQHVELYVNDWTDELGEQGAAALATLEHVTREAALVEPGAPPLQVLR